eukprot:4780634-Amphidinium_carterae.1
MAKTTAVAGLTGWSGNFIRTYCSSQPRLVTSSSSVSLWCCCRAAICHAHTLKSPGMITHKFKNRAPPDWVVVGLRCRLDMP